MIRIQYHPELLEQAVWLAARRDALTESSLHATVDRIYELAPCDEREARFRRAFADWFTRLKLDRFLDEMLSHFEGVVERIDAGMVRPTPRRKSEGAELFVRHDADLPRRTLVIQLCPESLTEPEIARDAMLRELQHVEDMLDEAFGYVPESIDGLPSHQQVVRDRYRILWDIRVEAILNRRGLLKCAAKPRLWSLFERAFTFAGFQPTRALFQTVWDHEGGSHAQMFTWAIEPRKWLLAEMGQDHTGAQSGLGEPCPLCRFPTFDWCDWPNACDPRIEINIRETVPEWRPADGICRQCAETLEAGAARKDRVVDPPDSNE